MIAGRHLQVTPESYFQKVRPLYNICGRYLKRLQKRHCRGQAFTNLSVILLPLIYKVRALVGVIETEMQGDLQSVYYVECG